MEWLIGFLASLGMVAAAIAGFSVGRLYAKPDKPTKKAPAAPLTEREKRERRELENFLHYDGFSKA